MIRYSMRKREGRKAPSVLTIAPDVWQAIDTPVALGCYLRLKYNEVEQLVNMTVDPANYLDATSFFKDHQSVKFLSKFPFKGRSRETRRTAQITFLDCEKKCRETNHRIHTRAHTDQSGRVLSTMLYRAQRIIAKVLGPVPTLEDLHFSFGPGANFGLKGDTSPYRKLEMVPECTHNMLCTLPDFLAEFPHWFTTTYVDVTVVRGSELTFVPKNAKTDRPICIEPQLNGLMQKGIGRFIRDRLRKFGIDLRDQAINQRLSKVAVRENLSTVDMKSASDMISYGLVSQLLPIDWFHLLGSCRSGCYLSEGTWYPFQKWSSMGNAYTFELESLIFLALAVIAMQDNAVTPEVQQNFHVYGDDVILPTSAFASFCELAELAGFEVNTTKSYSSGVFRESCGADWFLGTDVRPYFVKDEILDISDVFYVHNILSRIEEKSGSDFGPLRSRLRRSVPAGLRLTVPFNYGLRSGFETALSDARLLRKTGETDTWAGYFFKSLFYRPQKFDLPSVLPDLKYPLYMGMSTSEVNDDRSVSYSLRSRYRLAVKRSYVLSWEDPVIK